MFGLAAQDDLAVPVEETPSVQDAREQVQISQEEFERAEIELNKTRQASDSHVGGGTAVTWQEKILAQAELPDKTKKFVQADKNLNRAKGILSDARNKAIQERLPVLQTELKDAMQGLFEILSQAEAAHKNVKDVYVKANRQLGLGQREIPDLLVSYFSDDHGMRQSKYEYQREFYKQSGWI